MSCSLFGAVGELPLLKFQKNLNQFVSYSPLNVHQTDRI